MVIDRYKLANPTTKKGKRRERDRPLEAPVMRTCRPDKSNREGEGMEGVGSIESNSGGVERRTRCPRRGVLRIKITEDRMVAPGN